MTSVLQLLASARQNDQNYCGMDSTPHHGSACENEPDTPMKAWIYIEVRAARNNFLFDPM